MTAAILDVGPYRCLKICNPRLLYISYPNKAKSITISVWASDSYGTVKFIHGRLHYYGIPDKHISLIRISYEDMACRVVHTGQLTNSFMVKTGVGQGCILSPFLFVLAMDWTMKKTTQN